MFRNEVIFVIKNHTQTRNKGIEVMTVLKGDGRLYIYWFPQCKFGNRIIFSTNEYVNLNKVTR